MPIRKILRNATSAIKEFKKHVSVKTFQIRSLGAKNTYKKLIRSAEKAFEYRVELLL